MDTWKRCVRSAGKAMSIKFLVLGGGGVLWVLGGGKCHKRFQEVFRDFERFSEVFQRPSQRPSQSAIFLSELRVVLPLVVLPLIQLLQIKRLHGGTPELIQRPSQRPSQSAIFLSELRVVLPLVQLLQI